jgi:hypothetical protein
VAILLATTIAFAIIVRAGIAPAFAGAAMVVDNVRQRPLHSVTTVAAVSSATLPPRHPATLNYCLGRHRNCRRVAVLL